MNRHRNKQPIFSKTGPARRRRAVSVPLALGATTAVLAAAAGCASPRAGAGAVSPAGTGLMARNTARPAVPAGQPGPAQGATPAAAGSWKLLPPAPIANAPHGVTSVWTGKEMIIYGIRSTPSGIRRSNMAYIPASNTWVRLALGPMPPSPSGGGVGVWTGSEMLVLGRTSAAYNPVSNTWRPISSAGPGARDQPVVAWTGDQALVWSGGCCEPSNTGMAYTAATDTWTTMPASPLPPSHGAAGAWTGRELVIAGGLARDYSDGIFKIFRNAAAYNPATGTWRKLPRAPRPRYGARAVWDGTEVLFLGGSARTASDPARRGMAYNPATNTWRLLPPMEYGREGLADVWTGRRVLVWGGQSSLVNPTAVPPHGEAYDPRTNTWTALPTSALRGRIDPLSAWTGHQLIIWGGSLGSTAYLDGAAFTPHRV
jgi:Kelch motif